MEAVFWFNDWAPVLRIVVVGTLAYLLLVALVRLTGGRVLAQFDAFDFIISVALGASFARLLTAREVALIEAATAFVVLIVLHFILSFGRSRSKGIAAVVVSPPKLLYYRGKVQEQTMKTHHISRDFLDAAARQEGYGSLEDIEAIILESTGTLSVIPSTRFGDGGALRSFVGGDGKQGDGEGGCAG